MLLILPLFTSIAIKSFLSLYSLITLTYRHNPVFHPADNTYRRPLDSPNSVCSSNNLLENNSDQCEIEGTIDNETEDKIQDLINEFDKLWRSKMTEKGINCLRILK